MSYTEQELENKIRNIILKKIISVNPKIQLLQSKDVTDIICCRNDDNPCLFFIEIKHFSISNNRIGFGSKGKITFQPEILKTRPAYFEKYTRWIFCDSNFKDYYILSMLAPGEINHFGPSENRQLQTNKKSHCHNS